jgi:hypothetical protein
MGLLQRQPTRLRGLPPPRKLRAAWKLYQRTDSSGLGGCNVLYLYRYLLVLRPSIGKDHG